MRDAWVVFQIPMFDRQSVGGRKGPHRFSMLATGHPLKLQSSHGDAVRELLVTPSISQVPAILAIIGLIEYHHL